MRLLLEHRANINARDKYGNTPFQLGFRGGYPEMVELLTEYIYDNKSVVKKVLVVPAVDPMMYLVIWRQAPTTATSKATDLDAPTSPVPTASHLFDSKGTLFRQP